MQVLAPAADGDNPAEPIECEVQIRTSAQDLWSKSSHALLYKPAIPAPRSVARPMYRLLALVELYDQETEKAVREMQELPDYAGARLLREAEAVFHAHVGADYHLPLSQETLPVLLPLVGDIEGYADRLAWFASATRPSSGRSTSSTGRPAPSVPTADTS